MFSLSVAEPPCSCSCHRCGGRTVQEIARLMKRKVGCCQEASSRCSRWPGYGTVSPAKVVLLADEPSPVLGAIDHRAAGGRRISRGRPVGDRCARRITGGIAVRAAHATTVLKRGRIVVRDTAASLLDRIDEVKAVYLSSDDETRGKQ